MPVGYPLGRAGPAADRGNPGVPRPPTFDRQETRPSELSRITSA
jgi:hypothetical protein